MFPTTRLRRLRKSEQLRRLVRETKLSCSQMIWPTFVVEGQNIKEPIPSMPGQFHYSIDRLAKEVKEKDYKNLGGILLFGVPKEGEKDAKATAATRKENLVGEAIREIKSQTPEVLLVSDICLCAYTDHGHCGILDKNGNLQNDASLEILSEMALRHAEAGADIIAPSDMMDGRILAIRKRLDGEGYSETPIMSYAAKYASAFYGPFRDAAHCAPSQGDRKSYQMDPANREEALREMEADIEEGADILMVKPAMPYLDVILQAKQRFNLPLAAYQVSGEYAMLAKTPSLVQESLISIKRAGADILITYFAPSFLES